MVPEFHDEGLTGDVQEDFAVGNLDFTSKGFELMEGSTGFGEAAVAEVDAREDAAEGVGRGVAGVDEDAGTMGYVAEAEFLEAVTGAVVEFEPVGGKRDGCISGLWRVFSGG